MEEGEDEWGGNLFVKKGNKNNKIGGMYVKKKKTCSRINS